jgi:hypothetical protein
MFTQRTQVLRKVRKEASYMKKAHEVWECFCNILLNASHVISRFYCIISMRMYL